MGTYLTILFFFLLAYLIGSIPFGLIFTKIFTRTDIRNIGSGNIGATNVLRSGRKDLAFLTLLFDFLKGFAFIFILSSIAIWLDHAFNCPSSVYPEIKSDLSSPVKTPKYADMNFLQQFCASVDFHHISRFISKKIAASSSGLISITDFVFRLIILFPILGHCFPIWLKFKGGKGVATTFGVLFAAVPWAGFLAAVTWGIVAGFSRYSSLAALSAVALTPLFTFIYYGAAPAIITILIAALVIWRHKENIQRLTAGTEPKIGASKKKDTDEPAATQE